MTDLSRRERMLVSLVLSLFLVLHAPVSGLLTASAAVPHSDGFLVICADNGFSQVADPNAADPAEALHECLCPPGAFCAPGAALPPEAVSAGPLVPVLSGHLRPVFELPVQIRRHHNVSAPRAPPTQII